MKKYPNKKFKSFWSTEFYCISIQELVLQFLEYMTEDDTFTTFKHFMKCHHKDYINFLTVYGQKAAALLWQEFLL